MKIYQVSINQNYNPDDYDIILFRYKKTALKYLKEKGYKQHKTFDYRYIDSGNNVADIVDREVIV